MKSQSFFPCSLCSLIAFLSINTTTTTIEAKLLTDTKHRAASLRQQSYLYYITCHNLGSNIHLLNDVCLLMFFMVKHKLLIIGT